MTESINLINKECRTCFKPDRGWHPLTRKTMDYNRQIKSYGQLLEEITEIKTNIIKYRELSQFICGKCSRRLKLAHRFIQQAADVDAQLYSRLNEKLKCFQNTQIDVEEPFLEFTIENNGRKAEKLQEIRIHIERLEIKVENNNLDTEIGMESGTEIKSHGNEEEQKEVIYFVNDSILKDKEDVFDINSDLEDEIFAETKETELINDNYDSESFQSEWKESKKQSNIKLVKQKIKTVRDVKFLSENEENDDIAAQCNKCNRIYPNSKALAAHLKTSHVPEDRKCTCPLCGNKYTRLSYLYVHMRSLHGPESLASMKRTVPESGYIYKCDKCPKKYCREFNLVLHTKLKHSAKTKSADKASLCPICGNVYASRKALTVHLRHHTGEKPYKCEWCGRCFYMSTQLNRHRRQHTGDKPYKCQLCGKTFAAPKDVRQHMLSHSDERPHKCSQCERSYKSASDLKVHVRTHSGERPYICAVCGDTFNRPNSLRAHRKRHGKSMAQKDSK